MKRLVLLSALVWAFGLHAQVLNPRGLTPNGPVYEMAQNGDTLYGVGFFTRVGFETGSTAFFSAEKPAAHFPIIDGTIYAALPDGAGGWYLGGEINQLDTFARRNLVHLLPNGAVDPDFFIDPNDEVRCLALSGSRLYVGGKFTRIGDSTRNYLACFDLSTGAPPVLNSWAPEPNNHVFSLAISGSRLYVGGSFSVIQGFNQPAFAVFDVLSGNLLQSLSPESGQVNALALKGDKLYAGGTFLGSTGYFSGKGALFFPSDNKPIVDFPRFGGNVYATEPDGFGGWYIGGAFTQANGSPSGRLIHILSNYQLDPNFAPAPNGTVFALHRRGDTLFVGGTFSSISGQSRSNLAAIRISTQALLPWQPDPDGKVASITTDAANLYIGGAFGRVAGEHHPRFAALSLLNGRALLSAVPASGEVNALLHAPGHLFAGGSFAGNAGFPAGKVAILSASSELSAPKLPDFSGNVHAAVEDGAGGWYVAGAFTNANGQTLQRLAHILPDSSLDNGFSFTINNAVYALEKSGNTLYIGGLFTSVNGATRNRLAAIDLATGVLLAWDPNADGQVNAIAADGGQVFVAGSFTTMGGQIRNRLAAVDALSGALGAWNPDANQVVNALAVSGSHVYVGGNFTLIGASAYNRLARIDKLSGLPDSWNPNVNSSVNALLPGPGGTLYIGGGFTNAGGAARNRLAEIDPGTGNATAFNPNLNGVVESLALMGGLLYAGGAFTTAGAQPALRLAAFNPATSALQAWAPAPDNTVYCLSVSGTRLFAGGGFSVLKTVTRNRLMDFDPSTLALQAWSPNLNGAVLALALHPSGLIAGGQFSQADGQARSRLARWDIGSQSLDAWNPSADNTVNSLSVFQDTVYAGGNFQMLAGASRAHLGGILLQSGAVLNWRPQADGEVFSIAVSASRICAGGAFNSFAGQTRNRLFCLDTATDTLTPWAPDLPGVFFAPRINALAVSGDSVWVGGSFSTLSGLPRRNLALTDGSSGQVLAVSADTDGEVFALQSAGNDLWVGGRVLDSVNHVARGNVAVLDRHSGAVRAFDPGADSYVYCFGNFANQVALGGAFKQVLSHQRVGGFAMESSTGKLLAWNPGLGMNSSITSIALDAKGRHVYIGGYFSSVHGQPRQNLARVQMGSGLPDNWQADASLAVNQLVWDAERQQLFAGGEFFSLGSQNRRYLGAVDGNGQVLPFDPSPDMPTSSLALHGSTLYVSGEFSNIGGQPRSRLAALDLNGQVLPWAPQVTTRSGSAGRVNTVELGAERLYIGGFFGRVDGKIHHRVAAFDLLSGDLLPWTCPVDTLSATNLQRVSRIREFDNNLFVMGAITNVNGTSLSSVAWLDPLSGLVRGLRILPNGTVADVAAADSLLYLGGDFFEINQSAQRYLASFSFQSGFFNAGFVGISPQQGGNTGDLTAIIYGEGFRAGMKVVLRQPGLPDIEAYDSLLKVMSGIQLRATFNLRGQQPGMRDMLLIQEGDTIVLPDAFEVLQGGAAEVYASSVMPSAMRVPAPGRSLSYPLQINFGNNGVIDAEGVPIWLAIDTSLVLANFEFRLIPQVPGAGNPADSSIFAVPMDSIFGESFGCHVYVMVIPRIPAGFHGALVMQVYPKKIGPCLVYAWATEPLYGSPLKYAVGECMDLIIGKIVGVVPGGGCVYNALDALFSPMFDAAYDPQNFATASWFSNYALTLANAVVECGILATGGGLVLDMMAELLKLPNTINDLKTLFTQCIPQTPQPGPPSPNQTTGQASYDPNQKSGPGGAGPRRWTAQSSPLHYLVEFENLESATAPAQRVLILDTLDANVFDLSTLQLNHFSIADSVYRIPYGRDHWRFWVDLRPRIASFVRVDAALNGNVLRCEFESLDPLTLALQSGLQEGFLPPNLNDPEGRGSLSYSIRRRENLPTFSTITNRAAIYFDANAPIMTNTWLNTLDVDAPQSQMLALDSVQSATPFPLHWSGSDIGSGVRYYQVMVSVNGDAYRPLLAYSRDTTLMFPGEAGKRYAFYTIAVDSAGNAEAAPMAPDAFTRVDASAALEAPISTAFSLYPNPNRGQFTLAASLQRAGKATLTLSDLAGKVLLRRELQLEAGENRLPVSLTLPDGVYIAALQGAGLQGHCRFVVAK